MQSPISNPPEVVAQFRSTVIAPLVVRKLAYGEQRALIQQQASHVWTGPDGQLGQIHPRTALRWLAAYRRWFAYQVGSLPQDLAVTLPPVPNWHMTRLPAGVGNALYNFLASEHSQTENRHMLLSQGNPYVPLKNSSLTNVTARFMDAAETRSGSSDACDHHLETHASYGSRKRVSSRDPRSSLSMIKPSTRRHSHAINDMPRPNEYCRNWT